MTNGLPEHVLTKEFALRIKQYAAVLEFTTAIQEELIARKMNQQSLATLLDKSRAWVSKLLRKKPNLTFFTAVEVADALGLDVRIDVCPRSVASQRVVPISKQPQFFTPLEPKVEVKVGEVVPFGRAA